jgi:ABC-type glycerol-3-phosphate transport system permease component
MNPLRGFLLGLVVVGIVLAIFSRRIARSYAQLVSLLLVATVILMPFVWLACAAFKDKNVLNEYMFLPPIQTWFKEQVLVDGKLVPRDAVQAGKIVNDDEKVHGTLNLGNFQTLFKPQATPQGPVSFWRHIVNSIFLASTGTVLSMFFSSMGGYALSKFRFRGRNAILTLMLASLTVPAVALLAPNLQVISMLGWMDTYKALLVPASVSVFGIFLYRQAMLGVPNDLIEAGRIDGCGEFRIYLQLIMPLVRPMTGAFCLITFLGMWNSFLGPNVFLQTQSKLPLPVVLNQYIGVYTSQYGVFLAGTLLAIIPPAVLFLALQREFISGLTTGAVKQ